MRRREAHERWNRERERRLNQRSHSPAPWQQDPYLSSAGGGGDWGDEHQDHGDDGVTGGGDDWNDHYGEELL